jgi:hypothetical protein
MGVGVREGKGQLTSSKGPVRIGIRHHEQVRVFLFSDITYILDLIITCISVC